ncbi:hypothetical protein BCR33DRAFT_723193, partial [Rhizoclosmatium globosum]
MSHVYLNPDLDPDECGESPIVQEMLMYGIKPYDDDAFGELQAIRDVIHSHDDDDDEDVEEEVNGGYDDEDALNQELMEMASYGTNPGDEGAWEEMAAIQDALDEYHQSEEVIDTVENEQEDEPDEVVYYDGVDLEEYQQDEGGWYDDQPDDQAADDEDEDYYYDD